MSFIKYYYLIIFNEGPINGVLHLHMFEMESN